MGMHYFEKYSRGKSSFLYEQEPASVSGCTALVEKHTDD